MRIATETGVRLYVELQTLAVRELGLHKTKRTPGRTKVQWMDTHLGEAVPSGLVQRQIGPVHEPSSRRFVDFEGLEIALVRKATVSASERPLPFL